MFNEIFEFFKDVLSFKREYDRNVDDTNLITVLMKHKNISMQDAFDMAGELYEERIELFATLEKKLREKFQRSEIDNIIDFFKYFIAGSLEWISTTKRYSDEEKTFKERREFKVLHNSKFSDEWRQQEQSTAEIGLNVGKS